MFTVDCPGHGAPVLIWPSGVDGLRNTDRGIEVRYHCTCGHRGAWLTGRVSGAAARPRASTLGNLDNSGVLGDGTMAGQFNTVPDSAGGGTGCGGWFPVAMTGPAAASGPGRCGPAREPTSEAGLPGAHAGAHPLDELLAAWGRWQDVRGAAHAPAWARMAAFERYVAARARLRDSAAAAANAGDAASVANDSPWRGREGLTQPGTAPRNGPRARWRRALAATLLVALLAMVAVVSGGGSRQDATAGSGGPGGGQAEVSGGPRRPNVEFSPGL